MIKLVLLRHGESIDNKKNVFSGWTDCNLSEDGGKEARKAGKILKEKFNFDIIYTSVLKRAIQTNNLLLKEMKIKPRIIKNWRLNERMYGDLQGKNKKKMVEEYGEEQVLKWRRGYAIKPPALNEKDKRYPGKQKKYKNLKKSEIPKTESLKDTCVRVISFWKKEIVPELKKGKKILISAHGNSLRALVKYLDNISDKKIPELNIPTGIPLVYELNKNLKPIRHYYLGNKKEIEKKTNKVRNQTR